MKKTAEPAKKDPELQELARRGLGYAAKASELVVDSFLGATVAAETIRVCKETLARIEEKFKPATDAAHQAHKKVVALRKECEEPYLMAEKAMKEKLSMWYQEQEEDGKWEAAAAEQAGTDIAIDTLPPPLPGISIRRGWKFRVVAEDKIPDKFWAVDARAIQKVVDGLGQDAENLIPGIRVEREVTVVASSRSVEKAGDVPA